MRHLFRADKLTTFIRRLSGNLEALVPWKFLGVLQACNWIALPFTLNHSYKMTSRDISVPVRLIWSHIPLPPYTLTLTGMLCRHSNFMKNFAVWNCCHCVMATPCIIISVLFTWCWTETRYVQLCVLFLDVVQIVHDKWILCHTILCCRNSCQIHSIEFSEMVYYALVFILYTIAPCTSYALMCAVQ